MRDMRNRDLSGAAGGRPKAALAVAGALGLALGAVLSTQAQEVTGDTKLAGSQPVVADLDYREVDYVVSNWGLLIADWSSTFKKEPALRGGKVIRGTLQLSIGTTNGMAFAWDRTAGKLYLDLNQNLDLTDDAAGVFSCGRSFNDNYQTFTNVRLPFKTAVGDRPMLADLNFYDYGRPSCNVAMRSFWQGKVTLQNAEWQVGLLANPLDQRASLESGSLLLRPWADRNKVFSLYGGALEAVPFSRNLFVGNQAYQLRCTNGLQGGVITAQVLFTEQRPKLGELKITGEYVQRLTLEGGPYLVVFDRPGAAVKVPIGSYGQAKVCLQKGNAQAYLDGRTQPAGGRVVVSENASATLGLGGPLTNSVSVRRQGRKLALNYQLVGAGGPYQMVNQDRSHPPEFTVYQGDKKVGSGKFEFG